MSGSTYCADYFHLSGVHYRHDTCIICDSPDIDAALTDSWRTGTIHVAGIFGNGSLFYLLDLPALRRYLIEDTVVTYRVKRVGFFIKGNASAYFCRIRERTGIVYFRRQQAVGNKITVVACKV